MIAARHNPLRLAVLLLLALPLHAQWTLQDSHSTASLRGIHALGNGVAWASGSAGTILRTTDGGANWKHCTTPAGAEKLDFRGIYAFDAQTAIIMSSGKGDLSRLYKTSDACKSWRPVLGNPDKDGFWDAIQFDPTSPGKHKGCFGAVLGDPVASNFVLLLTYDCGEHWERQRHIAFGIAPRGEGIFAASNSSLSLAAGPRDRTFVTGGLGGPRLYTFWVGAGDTNSPPSLPSFAGGAPPTMNSGGWNMVGLPYTTTAESAGAFSLAYHGNAAIIVGGDYKLPDQTSDTSWYLADKNNWKPAETPPHGYRSAVAYDSASKTWITVGPNGTDLSRDDGRNWTPLTPAAPDPPDADKNWNALSLPFVVGSHGRIGKLRSDATSTASSPHP